MSRRSFVIGGAAVGAAAIGGIGVVTAQDLHATRRALHDHGIVEGPNLTQPRVDTVTVDYRTEPGPRGDVNYGLYRPPNGVTAVVYCLHGRGGNRHDAFDSIGLHRFIAARGLPWAVASLDGRESYWHGRADGSDTQQDLLDVLVPIAETSTTPLKRAVIGWSMGGYGALLLGETQPDFFAAVVASAPALWTSFGATAPGAFDNSADFKANDVMGGASRLVPSATRVDCGADDPFAPMVRELRRRVPSLSGGIHEGFHDDASWRYYVPAQLDFLQTRLGA